MLCGRRAADTHGAGRNAAGRRKSEFWGLLRAAAAFPQVVRSWIFFLSGSQTSEVKGQFPCPAALSQLTAPARGRPGAERRQSLSPRHCPHRDRAAHSQEATQCGAGGRGQRAAQSPEPRQHTSCLLRCVTSGPHSSAHPGRPGDAGALLPLGSKRGAFCCRTNIHLSRECLRLPVLSVFFSLYSTTEGERQAAEIERTPGTSLPTTGARAGGAIRTVPGTPCRDGRYPQGTECGQPRVEIGRGGTTHGSAVPCRKALGRSSSAPSDSGATTGG